MTIAVLVPAPASRRRTSRTMPVARPDAILRPATADASSIWRRLRALRDGSGATRSDRRGRTSRAGARPARLGPPNRTYDIAPHAGVADFDDSAWRVDRAESLEARRTHGRLSFGWYRMDVTIPETVGALRHGGIDCRVRDRRGRLRRGLGGRQAAIALGQTGGAVHQGLQRAEPRGDRRATPCRDRQIQLAVFGANGPLSNPPGNFVWVRSATLDFYSRGPRWQEGRAKADVKRVDPGARRDRARRADDRKARRRLHLHRRPGLGARRGYLLFSDPNANTIYRWTPDGQVSVFRTKSGYAGIDIGEYGQPGSNGITLDAEGRVTIDEHGNRRVVRIEKNGSRHGPRRSIRGQAAQQPERPRLSIRRHPVLHRSAVRPAEGVRRPAQGAAIQRHLSLKDGELRLGAKDLTGPNGLAFSPDERYLYVGNWDEKKKVVMRYDVHADGTLAHGKVFFDMTTAPGDDALDGVKVDRAGQRLRFRTRRLVDSVA